ncbi:MAG: metalloregulator ArsR/SmtB family transcription factor [Myxococcales bacterium]|nr:metalloregulator ArsR/SmtB family transcription factor [Myxococcales bacterium]
MPAEIATLVAFFKVLADATRLRIIGLLAIEERSVDELATLVDVRPPTVSHHLARLRKLGLVSLRSEGNTHWYRLEVQAIEQLARQLLASDGLASIGDEVEAASEDEFALKVKRTFMEGDRITQLPKQWRKKLVLVRHVAQQFEADRVYTEADLKAIIAPIHADHVTLRRLMVDVGWMVRDKAGREYRLNPDRVGELV